MAVVPMAVVPMAVAPMARSLVAQSLVVRPSSPTVVAVEAICAIGSTVGTAAGQAEIALRRVMH